MLLDWKYTIILLSKYEGNLLKALESGFVYKTVFDRGWTV